MALIELEDLLAALGRSSRPFSPDEEGKALQDLALISAFVSRKIGDIPFEETPVTVKAQADWYGIVELDVYPLIDVLEVTDVKTNQPAADWDWDGLETITHLEANQVVRITYTYGYTEVPADLKTVALALATRHFTAPLGIRQQTVGAISESYDRVALNSFEEEILSAYGRKRMWSMRMGPTSTRRRNTLPTL